MKKLLVVAFALIALSGAQTDSARAGYVTTTLSAFANDSSITLDAAGNPVVAYRYAFDRKLKILHCNDPNCTGGGDTLASPDPQFGQWPSIALDAAGNPVVSYYTTMFDRLKLVHCNNPTCSVASSITTPDPSTLLVEWPTSLVLDAAGNPVIAYSPNYHIRVMHCNDPLCAGGDESITIHDSFSAAPSLRLDAAGNPVVAYFKSSGGIFTTGQVRVMHCNDPNCSGANESVTTPDTGTGIKPSLQLDASGNPVIGYYTGSTTKNLNVMHCNDPNCAGGGENIATVDSAGDVGNDPTLALDASGNPAVTYRDETNETLKLAQCADPNCAPAGVLPVMLDSESDTGEMSSFVFDSAGNPAITYSAGTNLHLLRCDMPACASSVGGLSALPGALPVTGGRSSAISFALLGAFALGMFGSIFVLGRRTARL